MTPEPRSARCPRCGRPQAQLELCPACLLATAVSLGADPCPYEVLAPIEEDAEGLTWLAEPTTGRRQYVSLKVFAHRDDSGHVLARYREWKPVLAGLSHPSIAGLLDVGLTADDHLFVASEYVPGRPLTDAAFLASMGVDQRAEIARQLRGAVDAAHAAGVLHLELEASRIRVSAAPSLTVTILGFGSSLIINGEVGTPETDRLALERIINSLST